MIINVKWGRLFINLSSPNSYESSKRLTELISYTLSAELAKRNIFMFSTSPGNVLSNLSTSQASTILVGIALCFVIDNLT